MIHATSVRTDASPSRRPSIDRLAQKLRPPVPRARGRRPPRAPAAEPSLTNGARDTIRTAEGAVAQLGER